jgi:hypothetical protein
VSGVPERPGAAAASVIIVFMTLRKFLILPIGIWVTAAAYWFFSHDPAGSVMLAVFGGAMVVMGWILVPTANNVGPTAPVDPEFEEPGR